MIGGLTGVHRRCRTTRLINLNNVPSDVGTGTTSFIPGVLSFVRSGTSNNLYVLETDRHGENY